MKKPLLWFVYAAVPVTILCLGMYAVGQQGYRQNANDPQIQLAEDAASVLAAGGVPADVVPRVPLLNIQTSLAPWIAVYDNAGTPLEASAQLDNAPPQPPKALFNDAGWVDPKLYVTPAGNETRITWQPKEGVRQALVLVHVTKEDRYVVVGRSLRLAEERTGVLGFNMLIGWLGTLIVLLVLSFSVRFFSRRS